jgi:hypothetical protein
MAGQGQPKLVAGKAGEPTTQRPGPRGDSARLPND